MSFDIEALINLVEEGLTGVDDTFSSGYFLGGFPSPFHVRITSPWSVRHPFRYELNVVCGEVIPAPQKDLARLWRACVARGKGARAHMFDDLNCQMRKTLEAHYRSRLEAILEK